MEEDLVDETIDTEDFPRENRSKYNETRKKYQSPNAKEREDTPLNDEQWKVIELMTKGKNVHCCGAAGTGKSLVIRYTVRALRRLGLKVSVTAPTGVAANNLNQSTEPLNATTLHWWIGGVHKGPPSQIAEKIKPYPSSERWRTTDVLIIDEISMVSAEMLDAIDAIAKILRMNPKPFGGMQVLLCGDWFQLEPIKQDDNHSWKRRRKTESSTEDQWSERYKDMDFCFESDAWKKAIKDDNIVVLTENYRQRTDPDFQELLDDIREGVLTEKSIKLLKSRVQAELDTPPGIEPTYLMPTKKLVEDVNTKSLEKLPGDLIEYKMEIKGFGVSDEQKQFLINRTLRTHPADTELTLKKDAMVILLVNLSVEEGYVNGMQGVVQDFDEYGWPIVKFLNGKVLTVERYTWLIQKDGRRGNGNFEGISLSQLPLKLAYGLTIHKAQSIGLDYVKLNLGEQIFAGGHAYTGLSRAKSLSGLSLTDFHKDSIKVNPKVIAFYRKFAALKHRLIEDDEEEGLVTKSMIMKLLEEHIPSAVRGKSKRARKKSRRTREYTEDEEARKKPRHYDFLDTEDDCPL